MYLKPLIILFSIVEDECEETEEDILEIEDCILVEEDL